MSLVEVVVVFACVVYLKVKRKHFGIP